MFDEADEGSRSRWFCFLGPGRADSGDPAHPLCHFEGNGVKRGILIVMGYGMMGCFCNYGGMVILMI